MNNLHITLTAFRFESRIIKETNSLSKNEIFDNIYIAALHEKDLLEEENISEKIKLNRFILSTRKFKKIFFLQIFKYFELVKIIKRHYENKSINVINVHQLSLLPLGYYLKRKYKAKLIYDAHELETEKNGLSKNKLRKIFAKTLEKLFIYKSDGIIVVSESIADFYEQKYKIEKPVVVYNSPVFSEIEKKQHFRIKFNIPENTKIFLYQGGLETGRGIEFLLEAFTKTNLEIVLVLMGYGKLSRLVLDYSKKSKKIFFHEAVSPEIVLEYTSSTDYGVSLIENTCLSYYFSMPNKLFEYLMVGKPVIVSNMIEMATFVKRENLGSVMNDFNFDSFENSVTEIIKMDYKDLKLRCLDVAKKYSWEVQEMKMLDFYKKILK